MNTKKSKKTKSGEMEPEEKQQETVEISSQENLEIKEELEDQENEKITIEDVRNHAEYQELNNKYLRLYAEFENFRNRSARESLENYQTAGAELIKKILPTVQNIERALSSEQKSLENLEKGLELTLKQLKDDLFESGLEEINPEGKEFDPNFHEALMQQTHDIVAKNHVIEVFQKGYQFKNKILKHAQVITSKGKE